MKKFSYLVAAGAFASLSGCATNPSEVRNAGPEHRSQFVVQQGYLDTYRAILDRQRACEQANLVTAQWIVQGDVYADTKSGTITAALHGAFGVQTDTVIDVKAASDASTDVVISTKQNADKYAARVRKWIAGSRNCDPT